MKLYTTKVIDELVQKYTEAGGEVWRVREGRLGYGVTLMCAKPYLRWCVVEEVASDGRTGGHKVRFYGILPEEYERMLDEFLTTA